MSSGLSTELHTMCAKSGHNDSNSYLPFFIHSRDTAEIMNRLLNNWVARSTIDAIKYPHDQLQDAMKFIALVHDIGKITILFQSRIAAHIDGMNEKFDTLGIKIHDIKSFRSIDLAPHTLAGEEILLSFGCPATIAAIIGSHHGIPQRKDKVSNDYLNTYPEYFYDQQYSLWHRLWKEWINYALESSHLHSIDELMNVDRQSAVLMTGLLIMSDWIASNTSLFPLVEVGNDVLNEEQMKERANIAWEKLDFPHALQNNQLKFDIKKFKNEFGFLPNDMQKTVIDIVDKKNIRLMLIEAPMGGGKTEAALSAAEVILSKSSTNGVMFCLPSQATANGLFSRIRSWAEQQSSEATHTIELRHGSAELNEDYLELKSKSRFIYENAEGVGEDLPHERIYYNGWFDTNKTGLLADFVISTVDQLLMAALKRKHVMLKILGVTSKVIIVDECHSYDAYMNVYLDQILTWLGYFNIPVILLSATLSKQRKMEMMNAYISSKTGFKSFTINPLIFEKPYPRITYIDEQNVECKSIRTLDASKNIFINPLEDRYIIDVLEEKLSDGGCAGIIVNTVKKAQDLYKMLKETIHDAKVLLIHSGFTLTDRIQRESEILSLIGKSSEPSDRDHLIVVGTQVLEQSLDIDFDIMISQICPIDLLLQRIGRMHRHDRLRPKKLNQPMCYVLPTDSGTERIYSKWLIIQTENVIAKKSGMITLPADFDPLIEYVYRDCCEDEEYFEDYENYHNQEKKSKQNAKVFCIGKPRSYNARLAERSVLDGWLDDAINDRNEDGALAAVRESGASLEVIPLKIIDDYALTVSGEGKQKISLLECPNEKIAMMLKRQKMKLHSFFNYEWKRYITELQYIKEHIFVNWSKSMILKDTYFLPIGNNRTLGNIKVNYDQNLGFIYRKEDGSSE